MYAGCPLRGRDISDECPSSHDDQRLLESQCIVCRCLSSTAPTIVDRRWPRYVDCLPSTKHWSWQTGQRSSTLRKNNAASSKQGSTAVNWQSCPITLAFGKLSDTRMNNHGSALVAVGKEMLTRRLYPHDGSRGVRVKTELLNERQHRWRAVGRRPPADK
jgi:hypothetical protein